MMTEKKYFDGFINQHKRDKIVIAYVEKIINFEEAIERSIVNWHKDDLELYLMSCKSISPNTLSKCYVTYKNIIDYINDKKDTNYKIIHLETGRLYDLIDVDKFLSVTINPWEYKQLRHHLVSCRDIAILDLAWNLLSSSEISFLKEDDVTFTESEVTGLDVAILKISKTKTIKVEDPEAVENLKKCKTEMFHTIETSLGQTKQMRFRDTDYLIKPIQVGKLKKGSNQDNLDNPSTSLQRSLRGADAAIEGIDAQNLSIEDIRRSRILYLLSEENKDYFDKEFIGTILDQENSESSLYWLERAAKHKYK